MALRNSAADFFFFFLIVYNLGFLFSFKEREEQSAFIAWLGKESIAFDEFVALYPPCLIMSFVLIGNGWET